MLGGIIIFNNKFKDIKEVYNIVAVKDDSIVIKENNYMYNVYIYEVIPIILLDLSDDTKEILISKYKEFLRQVNFDFQVLIMNRKYNTKKYFDSLRTDNINNSQLYNNYILDMENKLNNENIFETYFYIIVSLKHDDYIKGDNVDNSVKILNKIGCNVERIKNRKRLIDILNMSINKE